MDSLNLVARLKNISHKDCRRHNLPPQHLPFFSLQKQRSTCKSFMRSPNEVWITKKFVKNVKSTGRAIELRKQISKSTQDGFICGISLQTSSSSVGIFFQFSSTLEHIGWAVTWLTLEGEGLLGFTVVVIKLSIISINSFIYLQLREGGGGQ